MPLSGPDWVSRFPTSTSVDDLVEPFRTRAVNFIAALRGGNATVAIGDTLRPPERAYLMYYSYQIARKGLNPSAVPPMPGVEIEWTHTDPAASVAAAKAMVVAYGIVHEPARQSRHTEGLAIDMTIAWEGDLTLANATISSPPRNGAQNIDLHAVGAWYGVIKLISDPPHWSSDGH